jgi:hypothetical protein
MATRPPVVLEPTQPFGTRTGAAMVDRYAKNPILDYLNKAYDRASYSTDPVPTMWSSGDYPPFCASGLDVSLLAWVPWYCRHSAALSVDRSLALRMAEDPEPYGLNTQAGLDAFDRYRQEMWRWATVVPNAQPEFTADDYTTFFGTQK